MPSNVKQGKIAQTLLCTYWNVPEPKAGHPPQKKRRTEVEMCWHEFRETVEDIQIQMAEMKKVLAGKNERIAEFQARQSGAAGSPSEDTRSTSAGSDFMRSEVQAMCTTVAPPECRWMSGWRC